MPKIIRHNVFETNSSSAHSLVLRLDTPYIKGNVSHVNNVVILTGGDFDWGWEKYNDVLTKANYLFQDNWDEDKLTQMFANQGYEVQFDHHAKEEGGIDHQSVGCSHSLGIDAERFIFDSNQYLVIGNDNSSPSPETCLYDTYTETGIQKLTPQFNLKLNLKSIKFNTSQFFDIPLYTYPIIYSEHSDSYVYEDKEWSLSSILQSFLNDNNLNPRLLGTNSTTPPTLQQRLLSITKYYSFYVDMFYTKEEIEYNLCPNIGKGCFYTMDSTWRDPRVKAFDTPLSGEVNPTIASEYNTLYSKCLKDQSLEKTLKEFKNIHNIGEAFFNKVYKKETKKQQEKRRDDKKKMEDYIKTSGDSEEVLLFDYEIKSINDL